jgi:hypothetical protein
MQRAREAEPTISSLLVMWIRYHLKRRLAAMRAKHKAVAVAAFTAESGYPPGA